MKNEITKEVFERCVPAAKTPERNVSVFGRMGTFLQASYGRVCSEVIGEDFVAAAEADVKTKEEIVRYVCLTAFVAAVRSLDLVLTATGFGVVSTESMVPASSKRVDELLDDLRMQSLLAAERIVERLIRMEGWGLTAQARAAIPTVFYRPEMMRRKCLLRLTADNWQTALGRAAEADSMLRDEISTEYMDSLLSKVRTGSMDNADIVMFERCATVMADYISNAGRTGGRLNESMVRRCVEQLESYPSSYPDYTASELYGKRHADRYRNKQEDPSFFFM